MHVRIEPIGVYICTENKTFTVWICGVDFNSWDELIDKEWVLFLVGIFMVRPCLTICGKTIFGKADESLGGE